MAWRPLQPPQLRFCQTNDHHRLHDHDYDHHDNYRSVIQYRCTLRVSRAKRSSCGVLHCNVRSAGAEGSASVNNVCAFIILVVVMFIIMPVCDYGVYVVVIFMGYCGFRARCRNPILPELLVGWEGLLGLDVVVAKQYRFTRYTYLYVLVETPGFE